jgi:hypothetical protein
MRFAFLLASVVAGWLGVQPDKPSLDEAQRLFYNGRFADSAAMCVALRSGADYDFENDELRTSALLFQMRRLLDNPDSRDDDKTAAWKACVRCQELAAQFTTDSAPRAGGGAGGAQAASRATSGRSSTWASSI